MSISPLNKNSCIMLALIAVWIGATVYVVTWGLSFDSIILWFWAMLEKLQAVISSFFAIDLIGHSWLWSFGLCILPGLLGLIFDGKGQVASGWLFLFGMGISAVLTLLYIVIFAGASFLSLF